MKRWKKLSVLFLLMMVVFLISCQNPETDYFAELENQYTLAINQELTLPKKLLSKDVSYESSSDKVVIANGVIRGVLKGEATITATCEGKKKDITINVIVDLDKLLSVKEYNVYIGDELTLDKVICGETITYSTSSNKITLADNKVLGVAIGSATIEASWDTQKVNITISIATKPTLVVPVTEYNVAEGEEIEIAASLINGTGVITYTTTSANITLSDNKVTGKSIGTAKVFVNFDAQTVEVTIRVTSKDDFTVDLSYEVFITDKVKLEINVITGNINDIVIKALTTNVEIVDGTYVRGLEEGLGKVSIKLGSKEQIVEVNVKSMALHILNESLEVDFMETMKLILDYPQNTGQELVYTITDSSLFYIKNETIYPLRPGKTRLVVQLGDNRAIRASVDVTIKVDPIEIIKYVHIEQVLMNGKLSTFGATTMTDKVMGGVSKYYFSELVVKVDYIKIYDNPYVGQKATPSLLELVEPMKLPRTGIKLEEVKYITYHDTGNNNAGAGAAGNISYMISQASIDYRARSWHFTIDDSEIIQSIPDDEVTWQGDAYGAYATSIGIETCVNFGTRHNVVWQKMGKLCGQLMTKYGLDMSAIVQHYNWNQKNCPQTLRMNNLYSYALSLIEAEWMVRRALSGYELKFESLTPEYLDSTGQIIKNPTAPINVSYRVTITNSKGYNESIELTSKVNPLS